MKNPIKLDNVFNAEIRDIVLKHSIASAAIAIIPGLGPTAATLNQGVMIAMINEHLGIKISKGKRWYIIKKVGLAIASAKAISFCTSFLPAFGSVVSAAIEGGSTYTVAYVYVKLMETFNDVDLENISDNEFENVVDQYTSENKEMIKEAFKEGKNFYKENKDSVSKEDIEKIKNKVMDSSD